MAKKSTSAVKKQEEKKGLVAPTIKDYETIIRPIMTEKSMKLMDSDNRVTVEVNKKANKTEIKKAFEAVFGVKVAKVNTLKGRGQSKTVGRHKGKTKDIKKAIVTLKEGSAQELFNIK